MSTGLHRNCFIVSSWWILAVIWLLMMHMVEEYNITHPWWKTSYGAEETLKNAIKKSQHVRIVTSLHCGDLYTYCWDFFFLKFMSSYSCFYFWARSMTGSQTLLFVPLILPSEWFPYLRFLYLGFSLLTPFSFWQPNINKESSVAVRRLSSLQTTSYNFLCSP